METPLGRGPFSPGVLTWGKENARERSGRLFYNSPVSMVSTFMTELPPKVAPANNAPLGIGLPRILEGHTHSVHNTEGSYPTSCKGPGVLTRRRGRSTDVLSEPR